MNKNDVLAEIQQTAGDIWKVFKIHINNFDDKNPSSFWDGWCSDLAVLENAYKDNPIRHNLYLGMIRGYADAMSEYMRGNK